MITKYLCSRTIYRSNSYLYQCLTDIQSCALTSGLTTHGKLTLGIRSFSCYCDLSFCDRDTNCKKIITMKGWGRLSKTAVDSLNRLYTKTVQGRLLQRKRIIHLPHLTAVYPTTILTAVYPTTILTVVYPTTASNSSISYYYTNERAH